MCTHMHACMHAHTHTHTHTHTRARAHARAHAQTPIPIHPSLPPHTHLQRSQAVHRALVLGQVCGQDPPRVPSSCRGSCQGSCRAVGGGGTTPRGGGEACCHCGLHGCRYVGSSGWAGAEGTCLEAEGLLAAQLHLVCQAALQAVQCFLCERREQSVMRCPLRMWDH